MCAGCWMLDAECWCDLYIYIYIYIAHDAPGVGTLHRYRRVPRPYLLDDMRVWECCCCCCCRKSKNKPFMRPKSPRVSRGLSKMRWSLESGVWKSRRLASAAAEEGTPLQLEAMPNTGGLPGQDKTNRTQDMAMTCMTLLYLGTFLSNPANRHHINKKKTGLDSTRLARSLPFCLVPVFCRSCFFLFFFIFTFLLFYTLPPPFFFFYPFSSLGVK